MTSTKLSLKERFTITRLIAQKAGEFDANHDVESRSEPKAMLTTTVQASVKRLDAIDRKIKAETDHETYDDLLVDELRESVYLRSYVKAWGDAEKAKEHRD